MKHSPVTFPQMNFGTCIAFFPSLSEAFKIFVDCSDRFRFIGSAFPDNRFRDSSRGGSGGTSGILTSYNSVGITVNRAASLDGLFGHFLWSFDFPPFDLRTRSQKSQFSSTLSSFCFSLL